jgi:DNA-binding NarL/FixJ family response regulator
VLNNPEQDYLTHMVTGTRITGERFPVEMVVMPFRGLNQPLIFCLMRDLSRLTKATITNPPALAILSPRQKQVLKLVANGLTSREIAEQLTISIKTVETHRANIMTKLKVSNVIGLVRIAIEEKLV